MTREFDPDFIEPHPREFDPNWRASTYRYRDVNLREVWTTQVPVNDAAAFEYFRTVHGWFPKTPPIYIEVSRPDDNYEFSLMEVTYNPQAGEIVHGLTI